MYKQSMLFSVVFIAISAQAAQQPVAQQNNNANPLVVAMVNGVGVFTPPTQILQPLAQPANQKKLYLEAKKQ